MFKVDRVCIDVIKQLGLHRATNPHAGLLYENGRLCIADGNGVYVKVKNPRAVGRRTFCVSVLDYVETSRVTRIPIEPMPEQLNPPEFEDEWTSALSGVQSIVDLVPFVADDIAQASLHHVCYAPGEPGQSGIWYATGGCTGRYFQDSIGPAEEAYIPVTILRIVRSLLTLSGSHAATIRKGEGQYAFTFDSPVATLTARYAADTQVPRIHKALLIGDIEGLQQKTVSADTVKTARNVLRDHMAFLKYKEGRYTEYSALAFESDTLRTIRGPNAGYRIPFKNELSFLFAPDDTGKGQCGFDARRLYDVLSDMVKAGPGDVVLKYRGPYQYECDNGATCVITSGPRTGVRDFAVGDTHWLIMPVRTRPEK